MIFDRVDLYFFEFTVLGTNEYKVKIRHNPQPMEFYCNCPYFEDGSNCKHIWASLLEIDTKNLLSHIAGDANSAIKPLPKQKEDDWQSLIVKAKHKAVHDKSRSAFAFGSNSKKLNYRVGLYSINLKKTLFEGQIAIDIYAQERLKKGSFGVRKYAELTREKIELYEDPLERDFLWDLIGRTEKIDYSYYSTYQTKTNRVLISSGHADSLLKKIALSGKLYLTLKDESLYYGDPIELNPYDYRDELWALRVSIARDDARFKVSCLLHSSSGETRPLSELRGHIEHFAFFENYCARANITDHEIWYQLLKNGPIYLQENQIDSFLEYAHKEIPGAAQIELPPEIQFADLRIDQPAIKLNLYDDKNSGLFLAQLQFAYNGVNVTPDSGNAIYNFSTRERIHRNSEYEAEAMAFFLQLNPMRSEDSHYHGCFDQKTLSSVIECALEKGWEVYAQQRPVSIGKNFVLKANSGLDWFDINAEFEFGSQTILLPQLLQSMRSGSRMIRLDDGSTGVLPQEWIHKLSPLMNIGELSERGLRLSRLQTLLLSSSFEKSRFSGEDQGIRSLYELLEEIKLMKPGVVHKKLKGKLRSYQKTGLGWLTVLSENKIGGILADDMGLGKTVQVLALLAQTKKTLPHLIVAPKSVIFNWENEAKKFTPHLKTLVYAGSNRHLLAEKLDSHDLIFVTYQTLRNDIEILRKRSFDFLIIDEAHYAKNSQAQISVSLKLIKAERKFALTGTPVENSLDDLFTILSIINPGLMSDSQSTRWSKETDPDKIRILARSLSPFILRRSKKEVLKDLPEKSEQILVCELSESEQKKYDELKSFYWNQLTQKFETKGFAKSKIEILEALLRLRQAACHQGLLDPKLIKQPSAKFELVLDQLQSVVRDGHKALVFSQFTGLLKLFENKIVSLGMSYEYLDGQTKDRAARVTRFQEDSKCSVFLISLKAGGVGLNLTAADYVFILDPWWNPAAESQAIDRAHRIGQKNKVFAYKVIAKGTIEEKIIDMQRSKKQIADAIVSENTSMLKSLKISDLATLFQ